MQGYLHAALKARQVRELEESQEEYAQLGAPVGRILRGDELRARLNSPRYLAALEDKLAGISIRSTTRSASPPRHSAPARNYSRRPG